MKATTLTISGAILSLAIGFSGAAMAQDTTPGQGTPAKPEAQATSDAPASGTAAEARATTAKSTQPSDKGGENYKGDLGKDLPSNHGTNP